MESWQQQILADIGISTWIRRDQLSSLALVEPVVDPVSGVQPESASTIPGASQTLLAANTQTSRSRVQQPVRSQSGAAGSALAAVAKSLDTGAAADPHRRLDQQHRRKQAPAQVQTEHVRYPEVACLWNGDAALFCSPAELHGQVRLVKDILATAANNWTQATEQVVFRWAQLQASGFATADAERALLAFAEKRIEVSTARWVLCTPSLQPLLLQLVLPERSRLLGLAELADLARQASLKQNLWQALQIPGPVRSADG